MSLEAPLVVNTLCRCRKVCAAAAGELQAGREAASASSRPNRRTSLNLKKLWQTQAPTRISVLHSHVVMPGFETVPALFQMPSAASMDSMVALLRELIAIPSVNPDQVKLSGVNPCDDPNCGEGKYAAALAEKFRALGASEVVVEDCSASWRTTVTGFAPRSNVYGIWKSKDPAARWVAVDSHLDTVMVTGMTPFSPFSGEVTPDGKIHGRGSCDTKAVPAIVLTILKEMQSRGAALPVNLILAGTVGEETGSLGGNHFREFLMRRKLFVDEILVAEPTLCTPVYAHKGQVELQFNIKGIAAHSSKPHLGKNALVAAGHLITRLYEEHEKKQAGPGGPLGNPTITPTLGGGGHGPNIVPQDAYVYVDYRITTSGAAGQSEDPEQVAEWMTAIAHEVLDGSIHCESFDVTNMDSDGAWGRTCFFQDPEVPWVRSLSQWSGLAPEAVTFGTNAFAYDQAPGTGIAQGQQKTSLGAGPTGSESHKVYGSCVVMGPGDISQAHMADEWVEIMQLTKMKTIVEKWFQLS